MAGDWKWVGIPISISALELEVVSTAAVTCSSASATPSSSAARLGATSTPRPRTCSSPPAIRIGNRRCVSAGANFDIRLYKSNGCKRILSPAKSRYLNRSNSAVSPLPSPPKTKNKLSSSSSLKCAPYRIASSLSTGIERILRGDVPTSRCSGMRCHMDRKSI